ncbi:MAG: efflux RND transporter periplasmic adaptor subunit [Planctomycetaceae bacterium]
MTGLTTIILCLASAALGSPPSDQRTVTVDGLVRLIEHVDVPARGEGRLVKVAVREGTSIRRGEVLGRLDDAEAQLKVKRAELEWTLAKEKAESESAIKSARVVKDVSQAEFERARLAKQTTPGSISQSEFGKLWLEAEKANHELTRLQEEQQFAVITSQSKQVELQLAQLALEEREFVSPLDGVVVQLHRREGEWVHPGDKVIRVVRIDRLRVEAFVNLQAKLTSLENAPVVLQVEFPDVPIQEFTGELVFMNPEADPVNGQIRIWAEIDNRDRLLRPGQRGKLKIFPKEKAAAAVPAEPATPPNASR